MSASPSACCTGRPPSVCCIGRHGRASAREKKQGKRGVDATCKAQSSMGTRRRLALLVLAVVLAVAAATTADAGVSSAYRRKLEATADMPFDADVFRVPPGYNAPQQVHITLGDQMGTAMTVSWVTVSEPGNGTVRYGRSPDKMDMAAHTKHTRYDYFNYTLEFIHHCVLKHL